MAVHPEYPGLIVEVVVDGNPLEEFGDEAREDHPNIITKYVKSQPGAEFKIAYNFTKAFETNKDVGVDTYVDGNIASTSVVRNCNLSKTSYPVLGVKSQSQSGWVVRKFRFGELVIKDNDEGFTEQSPQKLALLGTIKVNFDFGKAGRSQESDRVYNISDNSGVYESAMKGEAKSLQVSLGSERKIRKSTSSKWKSDHIFATFVFKYRTRADLQALGVIPRSPSPPAVPQSPSKQGNLTSPIRVPELPSAPPVATPQVKTVSLERSPAASKQSEQSRLLKNDMLILIKHYRGSVEGLEGLPEKELAILLSYYRDGEPRDTLIKQELVAPESRVRIKRESVDDGATRGQAKKRKPEVIVLDD